MARPEAPPAAREQPHAAPPPAVSPQGTLLVAGFNPSLRIERGALAVRLGPGREARIPRVGRPPLRRLVVYGSTGWWSFEVPAWLAGIGASWAIVSRKGAVLGTGPSAVSPELPLLRRAQALCDESAAGLVATRTLIGAKIAAQRALVAERFGERTDVLADLDDARSRIAKAPNAEALRAVEADAAVGYWSAWASEVRVSFPRTEQAGIPPHWQRFDGRSSPLTGSNRAGATPLNALLNIAYALLAIETTVAMRAVGLDPSLPVGMHAAQRNRANGALDLMEPARPAADRVVLDLVGSGPLPRRAFIEQPNGTVTVSSSLVRSLLDTMPALAAAVAPHVEEIAAMLAASAGAGPVPTRLTEARRSAGRDPYRGQGVGERKADRRRRTAERVAAKARPRVCRECGAVLEGTGRGRWCESCHPGIAAEVARATIGTAHARLAELRSEGADPSGRPEVRARIGEARRATAAADAAWDAAHPGRPSPEEVRAVLDRIFQRLAAVPLSRIAEATGLSVQGAGRIRSGKVVPHPRHLDALRALAGVGGREHDLAGGGRGSP